MDAPVFSPRPHSEPPALALPRAEGARTVNLAATPVQRSALRQDRVRIRRWQSFRRARWLARDNRPAGAFGPRGHLLALRRSGSYWHSLEPRGRALHRLYPDAPGTSSEEHRNFLGDLC